MARVAGVNIPDNKHAEISLTYVYGIGKTRAQDICGSIGIDPSTKISDLSEDQLELIRAEVGKFIVEGDLRREVATNIKSCLLYTSPSPRDKRQSRMPSSA